MKNKVDLLHSVPRKLSLADHSKGHLLAEVWQDMLEKVIGLRQTWQQKRAPMSQRVSDLMMDPLLWHIPLTKIWQTKKRSGRSCSMRLSGAAERCRTNAKTLCEICIPVRSNVFIFHWIILFLKLHLYLISAEGDLLELIPVLIAWEAGNTSWKRLPHHLIAQINSNMHFCLSSILWAI